MMKYNFDEVVNRKNSYSMKWDCGEALIELGMAEQFNEDTIPAFTADMDFRCAKPIGEAFKRVIEHNIYGYTAVLPTENSQYHKAIIKWFERRNQWTIKPEEITYVNGTVEAIKIAIEAFTKEGEGVLINRPIYTPFTQTILKTGRLVVNSQLLNQDGQGYYTIDFEDFEKKAADPNTKLFILCNPHNPSGRIWSDEDLVNMYEICRKNEVLIVADEIHGDLIRKGNVFKPLVTVAGTEGVITCTAVNKTFNLAGLHATNVVIQDEKIREIFIAQAGHILPTPFTVAGVIAAYNESEDWLDQVNAYLDENIEWVLNFLKTNMPKVKCHRPEGTYIMWMDFRAYGLSAAEIRKKIYVDANVILEGGEMFDPDQGAGFERICVPTRRALLEEVFNRIANEFKGL